MQLTWTDLATSDLDRIEEYIAQKNSPIVAVDVVLKVLKQTETILPEHPAAGRIGRLEGTRELVIASLPFIVIYRLLQAQEELQILRVLHDTQQWPPIH